MARAARQYVTLVVFAVVAILVYLGNQRYPGYGPKMPPKGAAKHDGTTKRPHIVMIVTDDQGYNDIGYHNPDIKSPTLDRLARTGVILENYYVQPVCTPTRSQLLSGRYQIYTGLQHGIIRAPSCEAIPEEMPLISDKLREAGYKTHAVGKWHVGYCKQTMMPTNRGFDTFFGFLNGHEDHYTRQHCDKVCESDHNTREHCGKICGRDLRHNLAPVDTDGQTYSTVLWADKAKDVIEKHDRNEPLFLYLAFSAVHGPLQVPERYMNMYPNITNEKRRTLAGMVTCIDEAVANVTLTLKKRGMWDDTVLVFTTDNGGDRKKGGSNLPLRGGKSTHFEGGIRAVGFVHSNLLRHSVVGSESKQLMHVTDWFPTFTKLAGMEDNARHGLDGFDQWDVINGFGQNRRTEILINIDEKRREGDLVYPHAFETNIKAAIRDGDWKLLTGQKNTSEALKVKRPRKYGVPFAPNVFLFNITADPRETTDVSTWYPDVVRTLLDKLQAYQRGSVPQQNSTKDARADPALHGGFWGPWL